MHRWYSAFYLLPSSWFINCSASWVCTTVLSTWNSVNVRRSQCVSSLTGCIQCNLWGKELLGSRPPNTPMKWTWGKDLACFGRTQYEEKGHKQKAMDPREERGKVVGGENWGIAEACTPVRNSKELCCGVHNSWVLFFLKLAKGPC